MPISINFCACNINEKIMIYYGFVGEMLLVWYGVICCSLCSILCLKVMFCSPYSMHLHWKWNCWCNIRSSILCTVLSAERESLFASSLSRLDGLRCNELKLGQQHSGATLSWHQLSISTGNTFSKLFFFLLIKPFFCLNGAKQRFFRFSYFSLWWRFNIPATENYKSLDNCKDFIN